MPHPPHRPSIVRFVMPRAALALIALAALPFTACSRADAKAEGTGPAVRNARRTGPPVIVASGYAAGTAGTGRIAGIAGPDGAPPIDSLVQISQDSDVCGTSLTPETALHSGTGLGGVVVWLADVKTGKPLPLARRFDVAVERCAIDPRVQAVVMGGTLDVSSADQVLHTLRFERPDSGDSVAVVSETESGSVVPVRAPVATPGLVAIVDPRHPWERGWLAVFDHPYFAVTDRDGHFSIDDVPAGTYSLHAWHERLGVTEQSVTVGAGETGVTLKLAAH
jgi:Polysaccharide lyase family 4, domain II